MKNTITNFALVLTAFVAVNLLMSFARPIPADEPKQYTVITSDTFNKATEEKVEMKFEQAINEKLAQGWHLQGGVSGENPRLQALVK